MGEREPTDPETWPEYGSDELIAECKARGYHLEINAGVVSDCRVRLNETFDLVRDIDDDGEPDGAINLFDARVEIIFEAETTKAALLGAMESVQQLERHLERFDVTFATKRRGGRWR